MSEILIRKIDRAHTADIRLKNEPFACTGRLLPTYADGKWNWSVQYTDAPQWECFPEENYDFAQMEQDHIFLGAYKEDVCIGLAVLQHQWHKYLYLVDLKVATSARRQGIGRALMEEASACAHNLGYRGLWAICQDNNLSACLFYLGCGFQIGGLDTHVYIGTKQEDKADIHLYRDCTA